MADSGIQLLRSGPEILSGAAIPFRFDVSWRSLTRSLSPTGAARPVSKPMGRASTRDGEAKEWEMVLPRMKRPATLALSNAPIAELPASESGSGVSETSVRNESAVSVPTFFTGAGRGSHRWWFLTGVALLLPLAFATVRWSGQRAPVIAGAAASSEMGASGWISQWASDSTGSARGRQISLYGPSLAKSDYRLEFLGRIENKSLGWVFRVADSRNYYVAKLEMSPGALALTRFPVIGGVEGPHIQRALPAPAADGSMLKIRLEATGHRFTVSVQNQVVEDWEDNRLRSGGLGFLNERDERGHIGAVQISFPKANRQ